MERKWRYVYEALQNVGFLRLMVFEDGEDGVRPMLEWCWSGFEASVVHMGGLQAVICSWSDEEGALQKLRVPLPVCLVDHSVPVRSWTREDHVEVRIGLLSLDPFLHALQLSLDQESFGVMAQGKEVCNDESVKPFSLNSDAQALQSNGGVIFFCRNCSCKLTNTPFRRILELPSADWREVAEHFYGTCCCASFGAHAESLVAKFQQLLTPSEGVCLVTSSTCIVHEDNIAGNSSGKVEPNGCIGVETVGMANNVDQNQKLGASSKIGEHHNVEEENNLNSLTSLVMIRGDHDLNHPLDTPVSASSNDSDGVTGVIGRDAISASTSKLSDGNTEVFKSSENRVNGVLGSPSSKCQSGNLLSSNPMSLGSREEADTACMSSVLKKGKGHMGVCHDIHDVWHVCDSTTFPHISAASRIEEDTEDPDLCCLTNCCVMEVGSTGSFESSQAKKPEALGNGFMTNPGSQPEVSDWEPFFCRECLDLVGAKYADSNNHGVQFFKCQISTHETVLSSANIFREHVPERVFAHELQVNTEVTSSYRYVVRSFKSGAALLQLVLLNQDASVCTGTCHTESSSDSRSRAQCISGKTNQVFGSRLDAVARFMFRDCRNLDKDQLGLIDKWAQLQKGDDIYMLEEVAEILINILKCHQLAYPPSCTVFQQFSVSFLRT